MTKTKTKDNPHERRDNGGSTLIETNPDPPREIALTRNERKKMDEIMLEYPTQGQPEALKNQTEEQSKNSHGQIRTYICLRCTSTFKTPVAKYNRQRRGVECGRIPRKENYPNTCADCR